MRNGLYRGRAIPRVGRFDESGASATGCVHPRARSPEVTYRVLKADSVRPTCRTPDNQKFPRCPILRVGTERCGRSHATTAGVDVVDRSGFRPRRYVFRKHFRDVCALKVAHAWIRPRIATDRGPYGPEGRPGRLGGCPGFSDSLLDRGDCRPPRKVFPLDNYAFHGNCRSAECWNVIPARRHHGMLDLIPIISVVCPVLCRFAPPAFLLPRPRGTLRRASACGEMNRVGNASNARWLGMRGVRPLMARRGRGDGMSPRTARTDAAPTSRHSPPRDALPRTATDPLTLDDCGVPAGTVPALGPRNRPRAALVYCPA